MTELTETTVEKVNHRGRETVTHLLTAANLSLRAGPTGYVVQELFDENALVSYRFTFGPEDVSRLKSLLDKVG